MIMEQASADRSGKPSLSLRYRLDLTITNGNTDPPLRYSRIQILISGDVGALWHIYTRTIRGKTARELVGKAVMLLC